MKREVIGWTCYDHDDFLPLEHHDFPEAYEALKQEIKEKGYLFSSQMHQEESSGVPVFDNYRILRLSQTEFARMMCEIYGGDDVLRYRDSRFIQKPKLPPVSIRSTCSRSSVFPTDVTEETLGSALQKANMDEAYYLAFPYPEKPIYWPGNLLLLSRDDLDILGLRILKIFAFRDCTEYRGSDVKYHFGIEEKNLDIYGKNGSFLVLKVQKAGSLPSFLTQGARILKLAKKNLLLANVCFDAERLTFDFCPKGLLPCRDSFMFSLVQAGEVAVGAIYTELPLPKNEETLTTLLEKLHARFPSLAIDSEETKLAVHTAGFVVNENDDWFLTFQREVLPLLDAEFWGYFHHLQGLSSR